MLTVDEIQLILQKLAEETVVERSERFPYRIVRQGHGYSDDQTIGQLQAKLSIMLQATSRRGQ